MPTPLGLGTLPIVAKTAAIPRYQRSDLKAGIVHIGLGNFHRAHQAVYLDDLFNRGEGRDFALIGAGVAPGRSGDAGDAGGAGLS